MGPTAAAATATGAGGCLGAAPGAPPAGAPPAAACMPPPFFWQPEAASASNAIATQMALWNRFRGVVLISKPACMAGMWPVERSGDITGCPVAPEKSRGRRRFGTSPYYAIDRKRLQAIFGRSGRPAARSRRRPAKGLFRPDREPDGPHHGEPAVGPGVVIRIVRDIGDSESVAAVDTEYNRSGVEIEAGSEGDPELETVHTIEVTAGGDTAERDLELRFHVEA